MKDQNKEYNACFQKYLTDKTIQVESRLPDEEKRPYMENQYQQSRMDLEMDRDRLICQDIDSMRFFIKVDQLLKEEYKIV